MLSGDVKAQRMTHCKKSRLESIRSARSVLQYNVPVSSISDHFSWEIAFSF